MTRDTTPLFPELSRSLSWEFGGLAYGLEPLTLPEVGQPDRTSPHDAAAADAAYQEVCGCIRLLGEVGSAAADIDSCRTPDELFWFRWITGHQVCFVIWRLMAQVMEDLTDGRLAQAPAVSMLVEYVRGYCAMLLYTGSCTRATYHSLIRPSMRLRHPSFSGGWAPDYGPVRHLFRGRRPSNTWSPEQPEPELQAAITLHQLVHDGVAARLVPDGRSLLRQSSARVPDVGLSSIIYDNYFLTLRASVSRHNVVTQLLRRLLAISQDLAANGLHPEGMTDLDDKPEELRTAEVLGCENDLAQILLRVARTATKPTRAVATPEVGYAAERMDVLDDRRESLFRR